MITTSQSNVVDVMWDVDDGKVIVGSDFEADVSDVRDVLKLVGYLRSRGVLVRYEDRDAGTVDTR